MPKLTKKMIDVAEIKSKDYLIFDTELPCFGVRIFPSGRKSYIIQYRAERGKVRRKSLGMHGIIALEEARKKAFKLLAEVQSGGDPIGEQQAKQNALTVDDLAERFIEEHVNVHLKSRTREGYIRNLNKFILPMIGKLKITDVTRADIAAFHHSRRKTPYEANRCLEIISKMFNLAEMWDLRPDGTNPRRHIKKYPEIKRERYLTPVETKRLGLVLREMEAEGVESQSALNCIRLLLMTGCRLGEIQTLQWSFIDWEGAVIRLPDSKTGARVIYAGEHVMDLLRTIQEHPQTPRDNPYVIYGTIKDAYLSDMQKPWRRIRKRAKIEDVRIHDLRHSFASYAASRGLSLTMIGKLLGHTQVQTTARYAHLMSDPIKQAACQVSGLIIAGLE
ncbi:tyrosine-type recombinase/integrase [Bartonella sp. DGB2]|uniref:tyrosine-type recombinase/integrase n=1 Tax=Bartonella sp. DGB2 TaxID=3388426 RepID=UPI00398FBC40